MHTKIVPIYGAFLLNYHCPEGPKLNDIGYYFYHKILENNKNIKTFNSIPAHL